VQRAADTLLEWVVRDNHLPEAAVTLARQRAESAADRFRVLEQAKQFAPDDLRCLYLREEPELLAAIKHGTPGEARAILNRILVNIYGLGQQRMDLLKALVMELIVMMSRAAVEAGASPSMLLGANYRSLVELSEITDEEDLARWVRRMLDALIEAIRSNEDYPHSLILTKALAYMREHLGRNIRRAEVARHAGVSPGHLAAVMTERMGRSFTEMLAKMRVDRAKELLRGGQLSLSAIAVECGFYDQSHLNKIFRKHTGKSPGAFRSQIT
jgi:two-component system response regulator YesN